MTAARFPFSFGKLYAIIAEDRRRYADGLAADRAGVPEPDFSE